MNHSTAFVPNVALRSSTFTSSASNGTPNIDSHAQRSSSTASRNRRVQKVTMNTDGTSLPDFDKIAEQLSAELKKRGMGQEEELPMPATDADISEQPIVITTGNNNMPKVILRHPPSQQEVEVYLYGAAVTSWKTRGEDHFWVSDTNKWEDGGKAIRGGIPICFPQFGPYGNSVQHGFARISTWEVLDTFVADDTSVTCIFKLLQEEDKVKDWDCKFNAEYTVTISSIGLETKLSVTNLEQDKPIQFTCAFHNYFAVTSIKNARVFGYEDVNYLDRLQDDKDCEGDKDEGSGLLVEKETDRIYKGTPEELAMFDFGSMKVLKIKKTPTLSDATLWNPYGAEGADPGWENFVCMEPACITNPAVVQPGETWVGAQLLGVE